MGNFEDLIGKIFERLTVVEYVGNSRYLCRCECKNEKIVRKDHLKDGGTKSCGCLNKEKNLNNTYGIKHGMSGTCFYSSWEHMKDRCLNPNFKHYKYYGGRGILPCKKWLNHIGFKEDMYESYLEAIKIHGEENITLERINNDLGYFKENCRWATRSEQAKNRRIQSKQKEFKAISPKGEIFYFNNQSQFARNYNLEQTYISSCLLNKLKTHKGWKFELI